MLILNNYYTVLHEKHNRKGTGPKVSKGRSESPLGSEAFVASGDKEKAERVSRNERPLAATIEAADAARRRETSAFGKAIVLNENRIMPEDRRLDQWRNLTRGPVMRAMLKKGGRSHLWTR